MKKFLVVLFIGGAWFAGACAKIQSPADAADIPSHLPRTSLPLPLSQNWVSGQLPVNDYWGQDPATYLVNGVEEAIAFRFRSNGTYEQYLSTASELNGIRAFRQSVTRGTVVLNHGAHSIRLYPFTCHIRRCTADNEVLEERDLPEEELSVSPTYYFTLSSGPMAGIALSLKAVNTGRLITLFRIN